MSPKALSLALLFLTLSTVFFNLAMSHCPHPCPHKPPINPSPQPGEHARCPRDALKLGVCANVLNGLVNVTLGHPPKEPCCPLLQGLADLEAAVCLCTALRGKILGLNLNLPISLSLLLNYCGKPVPYGFLCY